MWESLESNLIKPKSLSFSQLIDHSPSELCWYGEALLAFNAIPIYPAEPLFKVFHYGQQLEEYKAQGITEEMICENYMGIIMSSSFNAPLKY